MNDSAMNTREHRAKPLDVQQACRRIRARQLLEWALDVLLSADEVEQLGSIAPVGITSGDRYPDMSTVNL